MSTPLCKNYDDVPLKNTQINSNPRKPPQGYICYRCGTSGHFIRECPTKGNKQIKRSSGIPRSFMVPVDGPEHKGALLTNSGEFAVPLVQYLSYKQETKEEPIAPQDKPVIEPVAGIPIKSLGNRSHNYSHDKGNYYTRSDSQRGGQGLPSTQVCSRSPVFSPQQCNAKESLASEHGLAKSDVAPCRDDPLLRHQEHNLEPIEETRSIGHQEHYQEYNVTHHENDPQLQGQEHYQEYNVTHHENDPQLQRQEHYQEYNVTHHENGSSLAQQEHYKDYDVPPQTEDPSVQHQEYYQQYNMPSQGEVPLYEMGYQEYNVPPSEKDYFFQHQEQYPPHQSAIHSSISNSIGGPPELSQDQYSQTFPIQSQSAETFTVKDSQLPPSDVELSHPLSTNDASVFKSIPYESEEAVTNQEKNGSALLAELQKKLDKLYRKFAKGRVNRSRSRSIEINAPCSVSQSRSYSSSKSRTRDVSKSPTRTSHSRSRQQDRSRSRSRSRSGSKESSYSMARYRTGSRSHSRSRNESGDGRQSASSKNNRALDQDQQDISSLYSRFRPRSLSKEPPYSKSRYRSRSGSRSHSISRNESGYRHQSSSSKNIRFQDPDQQDISRLYSRSRSRSLSKERSYSKSKHRTRSGDRHQSASSENIRFHDPDQHYTSRLYSRSRSRSLSKERSYARSRYRTRSGSRSHSKSRNELVDIHHQNASSENIRSPRHRTNSRTFTSQRFRASSHRTEPSTSKHNYNHHK